MNDLHLEWLQKNTRFKHLIIKLKTRHKLIEDLPSCGHFNNGNEDLGISRCYVKGSSTIEKWNTLLQCGDTNPNNTLNKVKLEVVHHGSLPKLNLYHSQNWIESTFIDQMYQFNIGEVYHYKWKSNLFYIFLHTFYPNLISINSDRIYHTIRSFTTELLYNLETSSLNVKTPYIKGMSKTAIQNSLMSYPDTPISFHILSVLLSDYFNINIILIIDKLIIRNTDFHEKRLAYVLLYKDHKYYPISNGDIPLIHPDVWIQIENTFYQKTQFQPITKLGKATSYKMSDLTDLCLLLNINLTTNSKKKKKEDIYTEIQEHLPYF